MGTKLTEGNVMKQKTVDKSSSTNLKKHLSSDDKGTLSEELRNVFEYIANDRRANFVNMI